MEALNSTIITPISTLSQNRTQPRKTLTFPSISPIKIPNSVALLSSIFTSSARALTYEEALQQSTSSPVSDFDSGGIVDNVINFATENPVILAGGAVILALPVILSRVFGKAKPWGVETAKKAYAVLGEDGGAQLIDIRAAAEVKKVGSPDLRELKKKVVGVAYNGEDKNGFLKRVALKFKEPETTTLFILDKFDGDSELVAELLTVNGFKAAYAIKDGAEGPRGWLSSGLPWIAPSKGFSLDLSSFTDSITEAFGDGSDGLGLTVGIAAAAGLGALAFSEVETILQVLGSAAIIQLASKKLLFAEDRKQTLQQVDEFLNTKVAPKELADEIKEIGKALLPVPIRSRALPVPAPAPVEATPEATAVDTKVSSEAAPADTTVLKATPEAAVEPPPKVNSVKSESVSGFSRPLSPYPYYPDLKPPTSPSPSQP
ncbi:thylakoid rhodanese-like [Euphorbia peplus]|nr:thylakoid rhodanese-like [Euphorbia peplus]